MPSADECALFAATPPLGFILFARNCQDPPQVRRLTAALRALLGRADAPILIDQEGGRVQRLGPPHWRAAPAMARFGALAERDAAAAIEAAWLNGRLLAAELAAVGISVNCAPVLDVPQAGADPIIGDRACGRTPEAAAMIGQALASGLLAGGVLPVIKHIPGHGRANVDSHVALPVVTASREELEAVDFAPFVALARMPLAMTAHVVYTAFDAEQPATFSPRLITEVIRGRIGFGGLLLSDDIGMGALAGSLGERVAQALAAGCDVVLHCSGRLDEMADVAAAAPPLSAAALGRWRAAQALAGAGEPLAEGAAARLAALLAEA